MLHKDTLEALKQVNGLNLKNKKVAFVCGNFNILHPGHLRLLKFAKDNSDFLIVAVNQDNKEGAIFIEENIRLESIKSSNYVDFAFILRDNVKDIILHLKPNIVVKGKEHENGFNPELDVLKEYGGKLLFNSGDVRFSSLNLLRQEFERLDLFSIEKSPDFMSRHNLTNDGLIEILSKFKDLKVLVIGDIIVDEYISCDPLGMSQEDPTIVVTPVSKNKFLGGAGIVAAHARGLGANVTLFSVVGKDENSKYVKSKLKEYDVKEYVEIDETRPTTLKQRFRANGKTLLRVNHLKEHYINSDVQNSIFENIKLEVEDSNLVIFSDFSYGVLPNKLINEIVSLCLKKNIMMVADSQSSSQTGDISKFHNMDLIAPTEREARLSISDHEAGLIVLCEKLAKKSNCKNIFITLAQEGVLIYNKISVDKLPAMNKAPKDVSGAGDSMLVSSAMSLAVGATIWNSAYLGSITAACQVGRVGNIPLTQKDLIDEIKA